MPKPKNEDGNESVASRNVGLGRKGQLRRLAAVRKTAEAALKADKAVGKGSKPLSVKERGRHQAALKATGRLEERLRNPSGGKKSKTKAKKKVGGKKAAQRRKPFETATGMGALKSRLEGVSALITPGKKKE